MAWGTATGSSSNTSEMDWRVVYLRRSQPLTGRGSFHRTSWIRPTSTLVVNVEPFLDWPTSMCSQPRLLESGFRSIMFLWRISTDYVTYCERLSRYSPAVCQPCTWPMRRLSPGSACRAHAKKKTINRQPRSENSIKTIVILHTLFRRYLITIRYLTDSAITVL